MEIRLASPPTRYDLIQQIREEEAQSEQTEILIDYIQELWETIDLLHERFGLVRTQQILNAPCAFTEEYGHDDH